MSKVFLTKVKTDNQPSEKSTGGKFFGYKAYCVESRTGEILEGHLWDWNYQKTEVSINKWLTADNKLIYADGGHHTSGFHIFTTAEDVLSYVRKCGSTPCVIHRVEFKDIVALGQEGGNLCIIAKKVKVLEKVDEYNKRRVI